MYRVSYTILREVECGSTGEGVGGQGEAAVWVGGGRGGGKGKLSSEEPAPISEGVNASGEGGVGRSSFRRRRVSHSMVAVGEGVEGGREARYARPASGP